MIEGFAPSALVILNLVSPKEKFFGVLTALSPAGITLRGIDHQGNAADIEVEDFAARIFQHEIDHTDGHVYLDRMPDLSTLGYTIIL